MERRLSNVQLQQRIDSASIRSSRGSQDSGYQQARLSIDSSRQGKLGINCNINNKTEKKKIYNHHDEENDNNYSRNTKSFTQFSDGFTYNNYYNNFNEKRSRVSFWETIAGLVCSLGALATRAAKMATRRSDFI